MDLSDYVPTPSESWGPSKIDHRFTFIPVEFVGRTEKLSRFCDFISSSLRPRRGDDEEDFKFVDRTSGAARPKRFAPRAQQWNNRQQGGGRFGQNQRGGRWGGNMVRIDHRTGKPVVMKQGAQTKGYKPYYQRNAGQSSIVKGIRDWSTAIKPEYTLLSEINLATIGRRKVDASKQEWFVSDASKIEYENLIECGSIPFYDKTFDKIPARQSRALVKADHVNFYNVTTGQDPVMEELITRAVQAAAETESESKETFLVACTDQVMAVLMSANRSMYSWDLVITRNGNTILIDKRDSSAVDFLTVNENAQEQPTFDESQDPMTQINSPIKLGLESTSIVQNFSQQVVSTEDIQDLDYPNPFFDEEEAGNSKPALAGYIYRKAFIPATANSTGKEWNFIIRGEVNAKIDTPGADESTPTTTQYVSLKSLNEFDARNSNYRENFDKSRDAAVFATEMKNNACKVTKWLASAIVSGCDLLKVGFVARKSEEDPWNHNIVSVQTHKVKDLLQQMSISQQTMWSSVCSIIDQIVSLPDEPTVGRYLVVKDPSKAAVGIYSIPWDEFEDEDGEYDDEEGEGEDEEEDEE
jgi:translation initiation factor 3 subunit D